MTNYFREKLQAEVVQSAGPEDQPEPLLGGRGGAAPRLAPRPWQQVGRHRQALPRAHRQLSAAKLRLDVLHFKPLCNIHLCVDVIV